MDEAKEMVCEEKGPITDELLRKMNAYWRAANYLSAGQLYLLENPLLKKPLTKITINDIAEDCGINRMTFYYHFKDIYDLVEWSCVEDASSALEGKKA